MKIAFAYDGSSTSLHALKWGLTNLVQPDRDFILIFCIGITSVPDYTSILEATFDAYSWEREKDSYALEQAQFLLNELKPLLLSIAPPRLPYEFKAIVEEDARVGVVDFCQENQIDLLVLGCRGLGTFKRLMLGSVTDYCLHHAPCSVAVYKEN